jgi:hypothetical protein
VAGLPLLIASVNARVGTPIGRRGACLADGDVHARVLRVLHTLEVHEESVGIHDRDGDVPAVLLAFREDSRGNLLRVRRGDVRAVAGPLVLRRGDRGECCQRKAEHDPGQRLLHLLLLLGWWENKVRRAHANSLA